MKRRLLLLIAILCAFATICTAQKHDYHWDLGDSLALDFNHEPPRVYNLSFQNNPQELVFSIRPSMSSKTGKLIFYMDVFSIGSIYSGYRYLNIEDSEGNIFEDSDSILNCVDDAEGCLILPCLSKNELYYGIFCNGVEEENALDFGTERGHNFCDAYFSSVSPDQEMKIKNSKISSRKYMIGLGATKDATNKNWWIVMHTVDSDSFHVFLYDCARKQVHLKHEIKAGVTSNGFANKHAAIKFSKQGNLFVIAGYNGFAQLFFFDRCTGTITESDYIGTDSFYPRNYLGNRNEEKAFRSCEFSPDGSKLYLNAERALYQYDLNASDIINSEKLIWKADSSNPYIYIRNAQLAPNGKIYFESRNGDLNDPPVSANALSVIHNPDSIGVKCSFEFWGFPLPGKSAFLDIPHFPNYRLGPAAGYEDFGARPGPPQTICADADPVPLGGAPLPQEATYRWLPETGLDDPFSPNPLAAPDTTTTYTLVVEQCHVSDTATVTVTVLPELAAEAGRDTTLCPGGRVQLGPKIRSRNLEYAWRPATGLDYADRANPLAAPARTTTYTLTVLRPGNCDTLASDTVRLEVDELCGTGRVFLPNAFSPNGDGVNDELTVFHENLSLFHLRIYNRWGKLVFETRDPDDAWRGSNASEGVYSFVLEVATEDGRRLQKRGTVTLTR